MYGAELNLLNLDGTRVTNQNRIYYFACNTSDNNSNGDDHDDIENGVCESECGERVEGAKEGTIEI